jgi:hypothetical protein
MICSQRKEVPTFNSEAFASDLRELISQLEIGNIEQATVRVVDAIDVLKRASRPTIAAEDFGSRRVQETMYALDGTRMRLGNSDLVGSLVAARVALKKWEQAATQI